MELKNKIIKSGVLGPDQYYILGTKPIDNSDESLCLLKTIEKKSEYSLWYLTLEGDTTINLSPYKGPDYEDLVLEMLKDFVNGPHFTSS